MSIEAMVCVAYGPAVAGAQNVSEIDTFRVLLCLAEHADPWGQGACPSQRTIADAIGIDKRTVANALRALEAQGRITKTAPAVPRRRGATYTVHLIGDCIGCDDDGDSVGWSPASSNGDSVGWSPASEHANSLGDSLGDSLGWSPAEPEPDPFLGGSPPSPLAAPSARHGEGVNASSARSELARCDATQQGPFDDDDGTTTGSERQPTVRRGEYIERLAERAANGDREAGEELAHWRRFGGAPR